MRMLPSYADPHSSRKSGLALTGAERGLRNERLRLGLQFFHTRTAAPVVADRLFSCRRRALGRQQLQLKVAKTDFGGASGVKLKSKDAAHATGLVIEFDT